MDNQFFEPGQIAQKFINVGCKKTSTSWPKLLILGILAGAFIAFAAQGSNVAIFQLSSNDFGLGKALAGALFATGLMMIVVGGGELFTGNNLISISCFEKSSKILGMLKNWFWVYIGNFIGSVLIVLLIFYSGQFDFGKGALGGFTIKIAAYKTGLSFANAFCMGILCNWLVCMAVWMAMAAKDISGKLLAIFFPIWLFVASGFEHCVANMYYIPAGILAKSNSLWVNKAVELGTKTDSINSLNWGSFAINNLIPVTLGNIVGGAFFVGTIYWFIYLHKSTKCDIIKSVKDSSIES